MDPVALFVLGGLVVLALVAWGIVGQHRRSRVRKAGLERLGFTACPDRTAWLEDTVTRLEHNDHVRYEIREPRRLAGEPAVYYYVKMRHRHAQDDAVAEEEILFPLRRTSAAGLLLVVKPSSLAPGLATRMLGTLATAPWDAQPDDLQRLELPPDLKNTNLVAAMAPAGARLYDLVDSRTLSVVQGLGDAGGLFVQCRDGWCAVSGTTVQIPFRVDQLVARIRPLLTA